MENFLLQLETLLEGLTPVDSARYINAFLAILLSLVIGFITGPRGHSAAPAMWRLVDISFGTLAHRLDNLNRKAPDLFFRGFLIAITGVVFFGAGGLYIADILGATIHYLEGLSHLIEIILVALCITSGALIHHAMRLYQVMKGVKMSDGTYLCLARTSRFDLSRRDEATLARTLMEILARLLDKALIAPLIWYCLSGLPGLFIYSFLSALVWKLGYDGSYKNIAAPVVAMEKLMGFVPTLISGFFIALTSLLVPGTRAQSVYSSLLASYPYEQGGKALANFSLLLGVSLGGNIKHFNGRKMNRKWVEGKDLSAKVHPDHLKKAIYAYVVGIMYMMAALLGASFWAL